MVDVRISPNIPQWAVEKSLNRSHHNESPASTPDLDDQDRIRLTRSSTMPLPSLEPPSMLQDRYLSSEEDLSPTVSDSAEQFDDDDVVEIVEATTILSPASTAQPCKVAKAVSYVSAGRAKVVDMAETHPSRERTFSSPHSKRASAVHVRQRSGSIQLPPFAPTASPLTPDTPTFLNTDPFAKKEEDKTQENGKPAHRRLRSISRTLSLAKIALVPQNKRGSTWGKSKGKSDKNNRDSMDLLSPISPMTHPKESFLTVSSPLAPNMPPTPVTPGTPIPPTPSTAVFSPRTSSRMSSNTIEDEKEAERPPRTSSLAQRPRLVARGADEREPPLKLPPFPDMDDEVRIPGRRRLTKRKSMLGLA
ncbi:hypothetical protein UCRNP2_6433 [Neofusicoccum parvum UCRNP2]|uniref:Uncharacterized protein n=1 Tax=Botryosphaeria parva (strain UCR-NP2) TaxID=1287680 RepID=R1G5U8_BOTPV|nr:hypothetical protein UCRNP2_6433 [Neofusicoccum parvum UCRNP2]